MDIHSRWWWLNEASRTFLSRGYVDGNMTAEERVREIAKRAEAILEKEGFADKFYDYMSRGFYSLSSPVWSNFGTKKGLPISCNNVYVGDSIDSILYKLGEVGMQTKLGAGTSMYVGALRHRGSPIKSGGTADGPVHYLELFDDAINIISQGNVRRGNGAAYMDIEHPDVEEFLNAREIGSHIQNLSLGLCVSDAWMEAMIAEGDAVKDGTLRSDEAKKLKLWARVLRKRKESGYPYLFFTDTVNNNAPQVYKDKGMKIHSSNLCVTGDTLIEISEEDDGSKKSTITIGVFCQVFAQTPDKTYYVRSYDTQEDEEVWAQVEAAALTGVVRELVNIKAAHEVIRCTPDHRIWVVGRGWQHADDVRPGDQLITTYGVDLVEEVNHYNSSYEERVYDLTVPATEAFFANEVLVHNCSEIALASSEDESFVCNLMSMNVLTYDEWVHTDAVEVAIWFLDAVMEEYIDKTDNVRFMESANKFARRWRALGLGQLGWHSYLQMKDIAFESFDAHMLTIKVSKFIDDRSLEATRELALEYGEPEGLLGYGIRNVTRCAIAPTTSSSFIIGQVSPSIEPERSNYYTKDVAKGKFTIRNPWLKRLLESYGKDDDETWRSILSRDGSVQHLDFLTGHQKDVFKTFSEIAPIAVVNQAAARQKYVDQAQSTNLLIPPSAPTRDVNALIIEAWRSGVKTLYYQRSSNPAQQLVTDLLNCVVCEA